MMFGRVQLDNTVLTCDQCNFNQITARSRNRVLVTVVRDTCTTTVPPTSPQALPVFSRGGDEVSVTKIFIQDTFKVSFEHEGDGDADHCPNVIVAPVHLSWSNIKLFR